MKVLEIAEQIYEDIGTLCAHTSPEEQHYFFFNGDHLDYCLRKKTLPGDDPKTVNNLLSKDAYSRLQSIFSQCQSIILVEEQTGYISDFRRKIFIDYDKVNTDEQFAFWIFATAFKHEKNLFTDQYFDHARFLSKKQFFVDRKKALDNPLHNIGIASSFSPQITNYLFSIYEEWPKPWKKHCKDLFAYTLNQLSIPKENTREFIKYALSFDHSIFTDILHITYYSSTQVTEFLNNKSRTTTVQRHQGIFPENEMLDKVSGKIHKFLLQKSLDLTVNRDIKHTAL